MTTFSVSYSRGHGTESSPFTDWQRRGNPSDTVFFNAAHHGDDYFSTYMCPISTAATAVTAATTATAIICIDVNCEYYEYSMSATVIADVPSRIVRLDRLYCTSTNHWPEISRGPVSGSGGIAWLKANERYIEVNEASFAHAVKTFFGPDWQAAELPMTRPRISDEHLDNMSACRALFKSQYGPVPWHKKLIVFYSNVRMNAAITIQRHFRGWQVRMQTTFNPGSRIGAYYAMRAYQELMQVSES
jgi:hypothetical protein